MKRLSVIPMYGCFTLVLMMLISENALCQKQWCLYLQTDQTYTTGGNIPWYTLTGIDHTNQLGVYGTFNSADIFVMPNTDTDDYHVLHSVPNLYNTLTLKNSKWQNAGYAIFTSTLRQILFHGKLYGDDYVATDEEPFFRKLNTGTNIYDPGPTIPFVTDGLGVHYAGMYFYEWRKKVLLLGRFELANDKPANIALWDMQKKTFQKIGNQALGYDPEQLISADISSTDSTLVFLCRKYSENTNDYRILYKDDTTWANGDYPPIVANAITVSVMDKDHMFIGTQATDATNGEAYLYSLDKPNKRWIKLATFTSKNPAAYPNVSNITNGDGDVYFLGSYDSLNHKYLGGNYIWKYNLTSKKLAQAGINLPAHQCLETSPMSIAYIGYINHNLYGIDGCALLGSGVVYVLTDKNGTLPIQLLSFTAEGLVNQNKLEWETGTPVSFFGVQKSTDGVNFKTIGTVYGNSSTDEQGHFTYYDPSVDNPITYYRLEIVEKDGRISYSAVKRLGNAFSAFTAKLNNNPVHNSLGISFLSDKDRTVAVSIYSLDGKRLLTTSTFIAPAGTTAKVFDISTFPIGFYFIKVQSDEKIINLKFIKQ